MPNLALLSMICVLLCGKIYRRGDWDALSLASKCNIWIVRPVVPLTRHSLAACCSLNNTWKVDDPRSHQVGTFFFFCAEKQPALVGVCFPTRKRKRERACLCCRQRFFMWLLPAMLSGE
ncbi:unnamed protein product [Discosporangium mesarthrocarpum]